MTKELVNQDSDGVTMANGDAASVNTYKIVNVPTIIHDSDKDISLNNIDMSENKLLQRRRLLHAGDGHPPQTRSCSFKNRPRPKLLNVENEWTRRSSLPSPSANMLSVSFEDIRRQQEHTEPLRRVRSFKTTTKGGIINRGDSFKRSTTSIISSTGSVIMCDNGATGPCRAHSRHTITSAHSKDSAVSGAADSAASSLAPRVYRVSMLGDKGVGKTSLTNQFMTSEFVAYKDDNDDVTEDRHVTVLLGAEESTLQFIDTPMDNKELVDKSYDAFVVTYSITDRRTFQRAVDQLYILKQEIGSDRPAILIANKIDLVRKRKVGKEEGVAAATQYGCKYAETSAALNHHVDELLVGILSQIRLKLTPGIQLNPPKFDRPKKVQKQKLTGAMKLLNKIFKKSNYKSSVQACENLYTK